MKQIVRLLDQTELAAISQTLPQRMTNTEQVRNTILRALPCHNLSFQGFLEQADNSARQILDRIERLRTASKREAENLGHRVRIALLRDFAVDLLDALWRSTKL